MRVAVSSDHRGVAAARSVVDKITHDGHVAELVGACDDEPCDYPDRAAQVARAIAEGRYDLGVLICGTGIGMSIAANKIRGIRAAVVHDELTAQLSRSHNDANVLCLSADLLGHQLIAKIIDAFLTTPFEGGRHQRRIDKITDLETAPDPV